MSEPKHPPDASTNVDDLPDADGTLPELPADSKDDPTAEPKPSAAEPTSAASAPTLIGVAAEKPSAAEPTSAASAPTLIGAAAAPTLIASAAETKVAMPAASESGSIDVAMSKPDMPASASGSVDVAVSSPGFPEAVPAADSRPIATGGVVTAVAAQDVGTGPVGRSKRITKAVQDVVSGGVEKLGTTVGTIGGGVAKVADVTKKVPLVSESIGKLGEGLTKAGESIHALPRVAQTRRGRLLVRSVVVGFLLVFSWIAVIVVVQLRSHSTPDFRPIAEQILVRISEGQAAIEDVYEKASPRFQEVASKEAFSDLMLDLNATNGKFLEITAINETHVSTGPTGRVSRIGLTALYEHGIAKGSISFHMDKGQWKLLGIGIEVPQQVQITQAERQKRVAACIDDKGKDVSDQRAKCAVRDTSETILEKIRDGKAGEVWDQASIIFKQQETRENFIKIHEEYKLALGNYKRLLNVTEAKSIGGLTAFFDVVAEFEKSSGVRVTFNFSRPSKTARWELRSLKVVVPMPRPDEGQQALVPPSPDVKADEAPLMREVPLVVPVDAGVAKPRPKATPKAPSVDAGAAAATKANPEGLQVNAPGVDVKVKVEPPREIDAGVKPPVDAAISAP